MTDTIRQPCSTQYRASKDSGPRLKPIKVIVIHSTESGPDSAASVARYFQSPSALASTHLVIDRSRCYKTLPDSIVPWGAPGANATGYHIEHCGYARWSRDEWLKCADTLRRSAYKAAIRCVDHGIPARWIGPWRLKLGWKGFVTHSDVTKAYPKLGSHTDPGAGFPKDLYMSFVKQYIAEIKDARST